MLAEGETNIHKFKVAVSSLFGIEQSIPYGKYAWILERIRLAHATGEPKIGIIFGIDAGTATYDFIFVSDNEYFALFPFHHFFFHA